MTASLEELAIKADEIAEKFREPATFELVRACLNEAGVTAARRALGDALDSLKVAQGDKRAADTAEAAARKELDKALVAAEWELTPPTAEKRDGKTFVDGEEVVSWVAADKAAWKKRNAAEAPAVAHAADVLADCEHATAESRDALTIADKRLKACHADLEAAIAILEALCLVLPARKAN